MKGLLKYLVAIVCLSCGTTKDNDSRTQTIDTIQFPLVNPKTLTSKSDSLAVVTLDSAMRNLWTDKIMKRQNLYSSAYLAKFDRVSDHNVYALKTFADDWRKIFLITTNSKFELVDFIEITDWYGEADRDESGHQTALEGEIRAKFINDSTFERTKIDRTIYYYSEPNQITESDSVSELFLITTKGTFELIKKDSVRVVRRNRQQK